MTKLVTVVIPAFNAERHLAACLDSALAQTVGTADLEIVLSDDGSTDATAELAEDYRRRFPEVMVVDRHENLGAGASRNRGIERATGEYIAFLDADDWLEPDCLARYLRRARADDADVVFGGFRRVDDAGRTLSRVVPPDTPFGRFMVTGVCGKLHRREFLLEAGIRFPSQKFGEDVVFCVREIAATGRWSRLDDDGYRYRDNPASVTNADQRVFTPENERAAQDLLQALLAELPRLGASRHVRYFLLRTAVYHALYSARSMRPAQFVAFQDRLFGALGAGGAPVSAPGLFLRPPRGERVAVAAVIAVFMTARCMGLLPLAARLMCRGRG